MKPIPRQCFALEPLEPRLCLSVSVGWDGPGQGTAELSYYVGTVPNNLDEQLVHNTLESALKVWSDVADIRFQETTRSGQRDAIDFRFGNIDGPGRTLARAYLPDDLNRNPIAGDVQFDASEPWEVGNSQGRAAFDLMLVAVHEIGHALGLDHSSSAGSVMRAAVSAFDQFRGLAAADVDAVLSLYAAADSPPESSSEPAPIEPDLSVPEPDPVPPPVEPTTPPAADPAAPTPTDPADNPPAADEPDDSNPTAGDDPDDPTTNEVPRTHRWWRSPRFAGFGPFFGNRFGRFPATFISGFNADRLRSPVVEDPAEDPADALETGGSEEDQPPAENQQPSDDRGAADPTGGEHECGPAPVARPETSTSARTDRTTAPARSFRTPRQVFRSAALTGISLRRFLR